MSLTVLIVYKSGWLKTYHVLAMQVLKGFSAPAIEIYIHMKPIKISTINIIQRTLNHPSLARHHKVTA